MPETPGILYLVATPLGNLEDITYRAVRVLREVDLVAAEDTRHTLKLLNYFQIKKSLISYFQHNEYERAELVLQKLQAGSNVALVSDAGMPGISDPGNYLVVVALKAGIKVVPIPGASAVVTALAASGLDTTSFCFEGFLPRKHGEQRLRLEKIKNYSGSLVFYEAPHRLLRTLEVLQEFLGDRQTVLAREMTKIHEEFLRGSLSELRANALQLKPRGEYTIIVAGKEITADQEEKVAPVEFDFAQLEQEGKSLRAELRKVSKQTGMSTKELYQMYLEKRDNKKRE